MSAAILLALALALTPGYAQGKPPGEGTPRLERSSCVTEALRDAGADCYSFYAREDRAAADGRVIELPVAVLEPASDETTAAPVFFFPGGPGYSILGAPDLIAQYRKDVGDRPLVLLDHRGMIHAKPALRCPDYAEVSPYHNPVFASAVSGSLDTRTRRRSITDAVERCHDGLADEGIDLAQYNSHAVARDVDAIRSALGHERIDLYGRSTGGGTALSYLRYFPDHVRSVVVVSPWFESLRNRSPLDELHTAKQAFTDVLSLCVEDSADCRQRLPAWLRAVGRTRRALDDRPFVTTVGGDDGPERTVYLDGAAFLHTLYLTLPDAYARLPRIVREVPAGDYSSLPEFFRLDAFDPEPETPRYALGYFLAHVCHDMGAHRPTRDDALAMVRREPALLGFEPPWVCGWWDTDGAVPPEHSTRVRSDVPALSIHGQMDPCCGVRWGRHLAETMDRLRVVELRGEGHTPDTLCGSELIAAFLDDPTASLDDGCKAGTALRPWELD
ncbi:MAG: alpha/beta fold hydrolase [Myxococcota bacterium]